MPTPVSALIHAATMVTYKRFLSSKLNGKLHPWFVTGFTDGEGSFSIRLRKSANKFGYQVSIVYSLCAEANSLKFKIIRKS